MMNLRLSTGSQGNGQVPMATVSHSLPAALDMASLIDKGTAHSGCPPPQNPHLPFVYEAALQSDAAYLLLCLM
jgi:hypothetical protein